MKITAVIAEYNPFHFGHQYQLREIKKHSDAIAVLMSGAFVQRGEAAITDKWTRAHAALSGGADLILELPVIYALNTAREFATGAVTLLNRTHAIDELCFGAECEDENALIRAAELIEQEPPEISEQIQKLLAQGQSYPSARELAFSDLLPKGILSAPNNILAIEYIRALLRLKSLIQPKALLRCGSGYHELSVNQFASASGIRSRIFSGESISGLLPEPNFEVYDTAQLDLAVTAKLRSLSPEQLALMNGVSEGLENRILKAAVQYASINKIADAVKTKRYTATRIHRILLSALLDITTSLTQEKPAYLRVLGMNQTGAEILRTMKNRSDLQIVTKAADYSRTDPVFNADIRAQNLFALCGKNKKGNADFTTSPIIL